MDMYNKHFYKKRKNFARTAAEVIAPHVIRLCSPSSVVDVGCGDGSWLAVFRDLGVRYVLGLDGPWIDLEDLQIHAADFRRADLEKRIELEKKFDLAISLELAEHLSPKRAEGFVADLIRLSDVILFAAAIPGQGGVNHINEQWPSYWAEIFSHQGYHKIDTIRRMIWDNHSIPYWYRQNILLFANRKAAEIHPALAALQNTSRDLPLDVVHPDLYQRRLKQLAKRVKVKRWVRKLPNSWWCAEDKNR
jgi:SAM-dependent methyltransferase